MATVVSNALVKGLAGSIDNLLFRQIDGKTIVSKKPCAPRKQSEKQRQNRLKFKDASAWARCTLINPERRIYYTRMAKKLKLPNAYTAAITDYMRKGEIKKVDTRRYKGNEGDVILIKAHKKDFVIDTVSIKLCDAAGNVIERGQAVKRNGFFIYKATMTVQEKIPLSVMVSLPEHSLNTTEKEISVLC